MKSVIKDGLLVLPDGVVAGDLLIEDGLIAAIGGTLDPSGAEEIRAAGCHVLPGVIDAHVHFREPGFPHKESISSGSAAAVRGGVTTFLEMPNTQPSTTTRELLAQKKALAHGSAYANYGFFIGATMENLSELQAASGTPGIKIFAGSSTGDLLVDDDAQLEAIFSQTTLPICAHCEDETTIRANAARYVHHTEAFAHSLIRSPEVGAVAIRRLSNLAVRYRHRLHVLHISSPEELAALPSDPAVTAEACIPHLFLDTDVYPTLGTYAVLNPSLRAPQAREALWTALREGRVHTVATDHAPHRPDEKERPYPYCPAGIPSVENSLALMLDHHNRGGVSLTQIATWMAARPAQIWQIANKGQVREGFDADLVLVDLQLERTVHNEDQWTRAGWSPWHGRTLRGWPVRTLVRGRSVYWGGQLVGPPVGEAAQFGGNGRC